MNTVQGGLRLFCLPYAGGSEFIFRTWASQMPPGIEVCPLLLPGHGRRLNEAPFDRLEPLVDSLIEAVLPCLDRPYAFFGHSMGALLSFEVTRALRRRGAALPVHLFVSAHRAPQIPSRRPPIHNLPDHQFLEKLQHYNGTPKEVAENQELMEMFMPLLRADFTLCDRYAYTAEPPLDCPVTALGGLFDEAITEEDMAAWRSQTTGPFALHMFQGDHFYLRNAEPQLIQVMARELLAVRSLA